MKLYLVISFLLMVIFSISCRSTNSPATRSTNSPVTRSSEKKNIQVQYLEAIKNSDLIKLKSLINTDTSLVNISNDQGTTALHVASVQKDMQMVTWLIEQGAKLDVISDDLMFYERTTPLGIAVGNQDKELILLLLDKGAKINFANKYGETPLSILFIHHPVNIEILRMLLDKGADPNVAPNTGVFPPLLLASNDIDLLALMIEKGARINDDAPDENNLLNYVASHGKTETLAFLLEKGAVIDKNPEGKTAFCVAIENGRQANAEFLLQNGADPKKCPRALHEAARQGFKLLVELLLKRGADPNAFEKNYRGYTPLHYAAENGYENIVELLLNNGANPNITNASNNVRIYATNITPLQLAFNKRYERIVHLLLERGADPRDISNIQKI